jgi:hypothetical protein
MEPQDIKNLSLYCFSALIQADAAIFGLLAVFVVYQMQTLGNNQMNAYNLISSQGTSARPDFERLLLNIPQEAVHWILMRHSGSAYYTRLMTTAAFTEHWKVNVIKVAKWTFILLILHVAVSSVGLFYANELSPVLWTSAWARVFIGLSTFVLLLAVITRLGYRFLSKNSYGTIPEPPSIALASITIDEFKAHTPTNDEYGYLFSVKGHDDTRFISLKRGEKNTVSVNCITKASEGKYLSMRSGDSMDDDTLRSFLDGMRSDPKHYWSNQ